MLLDNLLIRISCNRLIADTSQITLFATTTGYSVKIYLLYYLEMDLSML